MGNRIKHGHATGGRTRLYIIWSNIIGRCTRKSSNRYKNYGGRGIKMSIIWRCSFTEFLLWALANGYRHTLTIDRIDNDGDYEPDNCQWITRVENSRKSRRVKLDWRKVRMIREMYRNTDLNQIQISKIFGVSPRTVFDVVHSNTWKEIRK